MKLPLRSVFVMLGFMGTTIFAQLPEIPPELPQNPKGRIDADDNGLDLSIQVTATVQVSPPQITLNWPTKGLATAITVYRKTKSATSWGTAIATLASDATSYTDGTVAVETGYEYRVSQGTPQGYVYAGINVPKVHARGTVILVVVGSQATMSQELATLKLDLIGDNWQVIRHNIANTATVPQVKALIKADYDADPANVKAVYLLGHVPVPYSGYLAPDAHSDHYGAWPADGFYGDMNGTWTDSTVNNTDASRGENHNVPGDGKYDQTYFSGANALELYVGRVDLYNMPAFSLTEAQLLKQYLDKAHDFRVGTTGATARALVDDNFNMSEGFSQSGWRLAPLLGTANIEAKDFYPTLTEDDYLWAYGAGGGSYSSASGIADTTSFSTNTYKAMFYMLFGSYFGDWDSQNNFLRAPLCSPTYGLTNVWAGRPHWFFHHMGLGETVGYAQLPSTLNIYAYGYMQTGIHTALMGDPTLRMKYVKPPTNASATVGPGGTYLHLAWTASDEPGGIAGYYIYRAASIDDSFTLLTPSLVTETTYDDVAPLTSGNIYCVQAIKLEDTGYSGSYYNNSIGAMTNQISFGHWQAQGLVTELSAGDVDGLATPGTFFLKPSVYGFYYDPVAAVQLKTKKVSMKVLTKINKTTGAAILDCEWTKKIKLYNSKNFKDAQKTGTDAATWLADSGNQTNLDFNLYVSTKEAAPTVQLLYGASLMAPELLTVTESNGGELGTLLTIEGNWFGTKPPKVWREYIDAKTGYVVKQQKYKVLKPTDLTMLDSKLKPSCMDSGTGKSKVVVVVPTKPPPGNLTDVLVLDNGVGMATGTDPTVGGGD